MNEQTEDVSCGDLQQRCIELEHLVRDCLLELEHMVPYPIYRKGPRYINLQDRAAALGIVPEVKP